MEDVAKVLEKNEIYANELKSVLEELIDAIDSPSPILPSKEETIRAMLSLLSKPMNPRL